MEGHLTMSTKERARMMACERVASGTLGIAEAAAMLSISTRQMRRSLRRYEAEGDAGLVHASRGRPSNRAADPERKDAVLARVRERYEDFGPTLASEKLAADGLAVNPETLRRWMDEAGIREARPHKATHRRAREPRRHFGELVQMDGSHHDWFEGRRDRCCLMQMVDDATGVRMMLFSEEETTLAALRLLSQWIARHGIPSALYTDKKSVYWPIRKPTIEEELAGKRPLTSFGAVCDSLKIRIIAANSPQAKGRVERANGVAQDRLVKELRLAGASTLEEGNAVIATGFLDARFARDPASEADFHRPLAPDEDVGALLRVREPRVLTSDYTLRFEGRVLQILRQPGLPLVGRKLTVARCLDGTLRVEHDGRELAFQDVTSIWARPVREEAWPQPGPTAPRPPAVPAPAHPWRQGLPREHPSYAAANYNSQRNAYSPSP